MPYSPKRMDMGRVKLCMLAMGAKESFSDFWVVIRYRPEILIVGKAGIGVQNIYGECDL